MPNPIYAKPEITKTDAPAFGETPSAFLDQLLSTGSNFQRSFYGFKFESNPPNKYPSFPIEKPVVM